MAKGGIIGNLRVNLGLDSAQFQAGLAKAGKSMDAVAKKAAVFGAAVGASMAGLATAMSVAVKRSINEADNMAKAAQKFGVGVEELSRLKHAADLSGVSLETLGTSLRKLSQNMQETANGAKNTASQAFAALGVAVKNSDGSLRSSTEVMGDVADRLSRMQDGAQKTALAMAIFGRSGSELIPMLNAGRDGINEMMQEADRLGIVLDTNTAKAAENFNDNMTRLGRVWDGLVMKLSAHLLPALEALSERMIDFVNNESAVQAAAESIGKGFLWIAKQAAHLTILIDRLRAEIMGLAEAGKRLKDFDFSGAWGAWTAGQDASAKMRDDLNRLLEQMESGFSHSQGAIQRRISAAFGDAGAESANKFVAHFDEATKKAGGRVKAAIDPMVAEAARIFEATRTPLEQYQATIARLNELLAAGAINQDTYNRAVIQAQDAFEQAEKAGKKTEGTFLHIGQSIAWTFSSAFQGLIEGSRRVKDVLADLLSQLGSMMMNSAFRALFSGGASGGSILGGLLGGFKIPGFAAGTNYAPGGLAWVGERGPELVNLPRGSQVIPNHALGDRGDGVNVPVNINIDATGADAAGLARVEQQLGKLKAEIPSMVISNVRKAQQSNVKLG